MLNMLKSLQRQTLMKCIITRYEFIFFCQLKVYSVQCEHKSYLYIFVNIQYDKHALYVLKNWKKDIALNAVCAV